MSEQKRPSLDATAEWIAKIGRLDQNGMRSPSSKDLRVEGASRVGPSTTRSNVKDEGEEEEEEISIKQEASSEEGTPMKVETSEEED